MKIVSFAADGGTRCGALVSEDEILDFVAAGIAAPASHLSWFDTAGPALSQARDVLGDLDTARSRGAVRRRADVELLAPVPRPGKVICIGLNYKDHAAESGMDIPEKPVVFSKFSTSVTGPGAPVVLQPEATQNDYEAELGVVIGRLARRVSEADAYDHVLGYVNVNDVSARDFQFFDGQWQRGKSPDTYCPMGPAIVTTDELADPHVLGIRLRLNGETLQDSNTDQLIFGVPALIAFLSETITLEPGDVIATGTPPGVGFARKPPIWIGTAT